MANSNTKYQDFTDRYVAANVKFLTAATISIFISMFEISEKSSVFGFRLENLNERLLEWGAFLVALFLGINYLLRHLDERKVLSNVDSKLTNLKSNIERHLASTSANSKNFVEASKIFISEIDKLGVTYTDLIVSIEEKADAHRNLISNFLEKDENSHINEMDYREVNGHLTSYKIKMDNAEQKFDGLVQNLKKETKIYSDLSEKTTTAIQVMSRQASGVDQIEMQLQDKKLHTWPTKFRIILSNILAPSFLFRMMVITFIAPFQVLEALERVIS